jgi:nicotinate dehydrogenase subunit A
MGTAGLHVCTQTVSSTAFKRCLHCNHLAGTHEHDGSHDPPDCQWQDPRGQRCPDTALLYVLRNDLELNGPKYGCGLGECGTCTVLINGLAARSCVIPISGCVNREIITLEGLGSRSGPDPVQEAFIREQAAQCGYCLNGMIMTTKALLLRNPQPTESEAMEALRYNLCRCGAHVEIVRAVMRAAGHAAEVRD